MDIVEFLTRRLDQRERAARHALPHEGPHREYGEPLDWQRHAWENRPSVVLAEVAAKRAILALHERSEWAPICMTCSNLDERGNGEEPHPCPTVLALIQPYADHSDFDPTWKVSA